MYGSERPIEVAVIGGGCAALAAAFELTRPELAGRYHVTVYQQGWRLGGKGASGRGAGGRIEEHGLHVWMGFYENAFRLIRDCYAELGRDPTACRFARWEDVFVPDPVTGVFERGHDGTISHWLAHFPPGAGTPGDMAAPSFSVSDYMVRALQLVDALLRSARREREGRSDPPAAPGDPPSVAMLLERISSLVRYGQLASLTSLLEATRLLELALAAAGRLPLSPLLGLVDLLASSAREQLEALIQSDRELGRLHEIVDIVFAILRGSLRFGLATHPDGFDAIDAYDWREWLLLNGASQRSVDSAFLHSLYDLAFAYEEGERSRPRASAGVALRCAVRAFLTCRGAFFWKMQTGMGDAVAAPLYEVLRRRGTSFRFFHRLENLRLVPRERIGQGEAPWVEELEFDLQAETLSEEYAPLVDVRGLPCWPSEPDWSQLRDGERMRAEGWDFESFWDRRCIGQRSLHVTRDFDFVVLGVGLGAIPFVAKELVARDPRWACMVREVKTIATQAFQLWLREPVEALGWREAPINLTGIEGTFETWADMRQLITEEQLPETPQAIAYFCSSLSMPTGPAARDEVTHPADQRKRVRDAAIHFLNHHVGAIWPDATRDGRFRFELLIDASGRSDEESGDDVARFETQYWTANVNPSDRYVLSVPGSARHRISPLDASVDNLTVAGDWTACGLDVGCVEAAVMSGRLAAHALSGRPALGEITGYDHP